MNVAQPIIDFWRNLARREQVLAGAGLLAIVIALLFLLLAGGDETVPIDASTTATQEPITERAVEPAPGTIVANKVPIQPVTPTPQASGVAPISGSSSSEGGGDATAEDISEGRRLEQMQTWVDVEKIVDFPPFTASVAAAGRDLERAMADFLKCSARGGDRRPCIEFRYGVEMRGEWHSSGRGITLTKESSDGHVVEYTVTADGKDCRSVDDNPSCTAWHTN